MRGKGITYDTGFLNAGASTRERFLPDEVARDMGVIHDELHCNSVRVTGGDVDRLEVAAKIAAEAGLEVWFSPFTCDLTQDELLEVLADCAERAERIRRSGAEVVLVTGAELGLFTKGILPGDALAERLAILSDPARFRAAMPEVPARINAFLPRAVEAVRKKFGGKVSYASIPFERVDWTPFDYVGVDAYRSAEIAAGYESAIRTLVAQGKPVVVTEFGCTTHRGGADEGARGWMIVEYEGNKPVGLNGEYVRDEEEQARYLRELLAIFDGAGVDTAFVFTFASYHLPHRADPREDLDLAGYGVVKMLVDGTWERKAAFAAVADYFGANASANSS